VSANARPLVVFGTSNMLGDILDCALALGLRPSLVVTNVAETVRPRTRGLAERLAMFSDPPSVIAFDAYAPAAAAEHFLGTTAPERHLLVAEIEARFGVAFATLVHPSAVVSPYASLAPGVFVGAGAVIAAGATLAPHVFVNRGVTIGHDTRVDAFARLMPGCNVAGHARIGTGATVGMGANVLQELEVGAHAFVGAGSVVTRDVPDHARALGSPARLR
jgi:sugar O-acyltransferase (sialic acid O-acetyltransferase NeuD family)